MLKYIIGLSLLTITCGCSQDGLEKEALDRKIDEIASSVNNGKQRYNSLDNLNDLLSEFRKCKTHECRLKRAGEFAKQVEENCPRLENSDYSSYIVAVRRFGLNVGYVITAQEEFDEDITVRADFCCRMLGKYKEFCFAIPRTAKTTTESEFAFRERLNAAHVLKGEYAEEASSWKRFSFPRIREKLAPDVRDEFDKKCAELLSFPSDEEFRRSPMMITTCTKTSEEVRCMKLNDKIDACVSSITNVCACGKYESKLRKIIEELKCETNTIVRDGLVDRLSGQVLRVDLTPKDCDYGELENRIYRYIQCAGAAVILQQETKGDRQWLSFFIKSGIKLKQACFSVPWESRRKDEPADEYRRRKSAAENLYNTYEQEVALWRCYKGTGGKSLLQSGIREEFVRKAESLFDYPTRNELLSEQGDSGVRKHRQTVRRDINGDVFLNVREVR